jgi:hypothetical protein
MIVLDAAQRLSKCSFATDEDWEIHPLSIYTCPHCGEQVSICLRDLERHSRSESTNLSEQDAAQMQGALLGSGKRYKSFLDFYCAGCRAPVRLYYQLTTGKRFGHGYAMRMVIESTKPID